MGTAGGGPGGAFGGPSLPDGGVHGGMSPAQGGGTPAGVGAPNYITSGKKQKQTAVSAPAKAKTAASTKKSSGSVNPKPVVSAQGILSDDTGSVLKTGGQQILTTPFGIVGGGNVTKKTLLGG